MQQGPNGPQRPKYLLCGCLRRMFADPGSGPSTEQQRAGLSVAVAHFCGEDKIARLFLNAQPEDRQQLPSAVAAIP